MYNRDTAEGAAPFCQTEERQNGDDIVQEESKGTVLNEESVAKYTVKDSVFTSLFKDKKYLIQLYHALHPEDQETVEDELTDITIRNVLTNGIHNDLGFRVGEKLMILVEAQSSWTKNIIIRALLYLVQTYHDYFEQQGVNLYGSKKVKMPEPELYVIFTGDRKDRPQTLSLSEEYFNGKECSIEVKVKVIYDGKDNDIISQYVTFTKVYNEQVKLHGRTRIAITETIRICKNRDVLREYLTSREKEVITIMMTLFDEERIIHAYVAEERREAVEESVKYTVEKMLKAGKLSVEEIAGYFKELSVEDVQEIEKGMLQTM